MARFLGVSPNTIMGQVERLGRHCLLLHQWLRPKHAPLEPVVVDGFETFEFSQYFPHHINLAVGAPSHFRYAFTEADLRRKGRTTAAQKKRLAELDRRVGRPNPKALVVSMTDLIELVAPKGSRLVVRSDEHPAYPRAFQGVEQVDIVHETTSSKRARTARNPLFPVNRADLLIRHCGANHKRETIAYSKRRQSSMERHAIHEVWINYQKPFSEKKKDAPPAVKLGLIPHALTTREILGRRLFPRQIELPECWQRYYDREIVTRCLPNGKRHRLTYAY